MKQFIQNLISSLDTHSKGFSGRKLSAFVIVACVVSAHVKWMALGDFTQLISVLTVDYGFVALLLGLTTYESIKKPVKDETPQT